jgi:catecholate siderophore receptor
LLNPNANDPWVYTRSVSPARTNIVTNTRSVYGFDTIEFTPQWLLNVGIRWDDYKSSLNTPQYTLDGKTTAATSANVHATFASYQAGLVYKPSTNSSVYVSYGTSSTPPGNDGGDGIDGLTVAIQNLKPQEEQELRTGHEMGSAARWPFVRERRLFPERHEQCARDGTGRQHAKRGRQASQGHRAGRER